MSIELNNNSETHHYHKLIEETATVYKRDRRNESIVSCSSASSCHSSDSSAAEDVEGLSPKSSALRDFEQNSTHNAISREVLLKGEHEMRARSMSDGAAECALNPDFEVFPSLPDALLNKLELRGNGTKERLTDEELEQKFVTLAMAFAIDTTTVKDRCERQRRFRDQTERNLTVELEKLTEKANRIQPLCIDAETAELLSALLQQIDIVIRASLLAAISSERYGAVQQEERLAESVTLMISHVNLLKRQRDAARRQLQYTKKVLQDTNPPQADKTKQKMSVLANGRLVTKRRFSIATIDRPQDTTINKIIRRPSEYSIRATSSVSRGSRTSRLDLGVDLGKIKEGMVENELDSNDQQHLQNQSDNEESMSDGQEEERPESTENLPIRLQLVRRFNCFRQKFERKYASWSEDGTLHEICCFCAIICLSMSIMIVANLLIVNQSPAKFFWYWTTGNNNGDKSAK